VRIAWSISDDEPRDRKLDLPYDTAEAFKFAAIAFGILTFPCFIVRGSFSLKVYASASIAMAAVFLLTLFDALGPPVECFTSGGNTPMNDAIMFASGFILILYLLSTLLSPSEEQLIGLGGSIREAINSDVRP
jgi:hypothetical protein